MDSANDEGTQMSDKGDRNGPTRPGNPGMPKKGGKGK
jgi:hypothetical protein